MKDPLESATLKDELQYRLEDWIEEYAYDVRAGGSLVRFDEETIASLVSEVYNFLTEVQEGGDLPLPAETDDEEEEEG